MHERVVITGMGIFSALGTEYDSIFQRMKLKKTGISNVERFDTQPFHAHIGAETKDDQPEKFFSAEQRKRYDQCAQYAIITLVKAMQDSGLELTPALKARTGLALGTCNGGILSLEEQWTIKDLDDVRTARYPYFQQGDDAASYLDIHGPVMTLNTACAASGNAIGFGFDMIRGGYADVMLAGGTDPLSHTVYAGFNVLRALNPQPTAPYGDRYGLSLGEGASFVVLETKSAAVERGAHIYAEICGYGMSNDAYHATASEPEGRGIQIAVTMALEDGQVDKGQIGYINAHGTGTKANDAAEIKGLRAVFGKENLANIPLNSSKAYFGHCLGAAAAIELTTALYAIEQGWLPATLHHDATREGCEDAHIIANDMLAGNPEYLLCNNSAFGGHNASILARTGDFLNQNVTNGRNSPSLRRIGIVGMGQTSTLGILKGSMNHVVMQKKSPVSEQLDFSLKTYDISLYERRMNRLCQYSIASGHLAMQDAGWMVDEEKGKQIGLIYGTSRGSMSSIEQYLKSIFEHDPSFASSIHFPFNVINSTAGKMAHKLRLQGYSSSLSTGGNDGLMSILYGYELICRNVHQQCLIGAGDELSELSSRISQAKGLLTSRFASVEGSSCVALADIGRDSSNHSKVYAEIAGIGLFYQGSDALTGTGYDEAISHALERAGIGRNSIDFVLFNSIGRPGEVEREQMQIESYFNDQRVPVTCFNHVFGYGESLSSLQHLSLAADQIYHSEGRYTHGLVISSSVNGSMIAVVLKQADYEKGGDIC